FLADDQGRTLVLSADTAPTCGDQAAVGRLDFGWSLCDDALVGCGVAAAIAFGRNCDSDVAVSCRDLRLRNSCGIVCLQRVRIKSAESPAGNARSHRHAAGAHNFSHRLADLEKTPRG